MKKYAKYPALAVTLAIAGSDLCLVHLAAGGAVHPRSAAPFFVSLAAIVLCVRDRVQALCAPDKSHHAAVVPHHKP